MSDVVSPLRGVHTWSQSDSHGRAHRRGLGAIGRQHRRNVEGDGRTASSAAREALSCCLLIEGLLAHQRLESVETDVDDVADTALQGPPAGLVPDVLSAVGRTTPSRLLHALGRFSESSAASAGAAAVSAAFLLVALLAPRATPWLTAFQALAAAVTLVMVFALQHTQSRQQAALQRKLDEILRVLPGADARLVHLETAPGSELAALAEDHIRLREEALSGQYPTGGESS